MLTSKPSGNRLRLLPALLVGLMLALLPASAIADTGDPLLYYGGPVMHSTTGMLVDWGGGVSPIFTNPTTGDPAFISYLASASGSTSDLSGVLAQYMDSSGHNAANRVSYAGQYQITPSVTSNTIQDAQVQQELVAQIGAGHLPRPTGNGLSNIYLVLFPPGDTICTPDPSAGQVCSGDFFCAYHGSTQLADGTNVLYAVLPDNTTGSMTWGCGDAAGALQNQTAFLSHEWSETITDPLVGEASGDSAPLAWYDDRCSSAATSCNNGEIGDKCEQQQASNGPWTVQTEWSNRDSACVASEPAYAQPTASFTAPGAVAAGTSAAFSASASSDPAQNTARALDAGSPLSLSYSIASGVVGYDWNWGDGTPDGSGVNASHLYTSAGTYQVSLTVTDTLGFTSTLTRALTVATPAVTAPAPAPSGTGTAPTGGSTSSTGTGETGTAATASPAPATTSTATPTPAPTDSTTPSTSSQAPAPSSAPAQQPTSAPVAHAATPLVRLGRRAQVSARQVVVRGWVKPGRGMTRVHVEFGRTGALGHSSAVLRLSRRGGWHAVRLNLVGLRPHTRYLLRLVASGSRGTAVTRELSVVTRRGGGHAPRLALRAATLGAVVASAAHARRSVRVTFRCSSACTVHLSLIPRLSPRLRAITAPLVLSRASATLRHGGRGVLRLAVVRRRARGRDSALLVSGYAASPSGADSPSLSISARG